MRFPLKKPGGIKSLRGGHPRTQPLCCLSFYLRLHHFLSRLPLLIWASLPASSSLSLRPSPPSLPSACPPGSHFLSRLSILYAHSHIFTFPLAKKVVQLSGCFSTSIMNFLEGPGLALLGSGGHPCPNQLWPVGRVHGVAVSAGSLHPGNGN